MHFNIDCLNIFLPIFVYKLPLLLGHHFNMRLEIIFILSPLCTWLLTHKVLVRSMQMKIWHFKKWKYDTCKLGCEEDKVKMLLKHVWCHFLSWCIHKSFYQHKIIPLKQNTTDLTKTRLKQKIVILNQDE